jgi:hypothetical protein
MEEILTKINIMGMDVVVMDVVVVDVVVVTETKRKGSSGKLHTPFERGEEM